MPVSPGGAKSCKKKMRIENEYLHSDNLKGQKTTDDTT